MTRGRTVARTDGRIQRAERSREAIVEALLGLVGEGTPVPTAQQVADRAGVGIRTVFRHFADMESLFAELSERLRAELAPLLRGRAPEGSVEARLRELALRRARLFERIQPFRRSTQILRWSSPFLEEQLRSDHRELRAELRRWLPELEGAEPDRLEALDAALSYDFWNRLRFEQRLGPKRAQATLGRVVLAMAADLD